MKNRDIEKQLKREAQEHTPEVYDKIRLSAQSEGLLRGETDSGLRQGNTAVRTVNRKRLLICAAALLTALFLCLAIVLPLTLRKTGGGNLPHGITLSANDVYGMGAVSAVKLLGQEPALPTKRLSAKSASEAKAQARKFHEYFTALDSFMGEEIVTTVSEQNPDREYPYETKMTIKSYDFYGNAVENIMYFTETKVLSDDEETVYSLLGVLASDGTDYHLEGERSFEQEDGETENELWIRAYADPNDKTSFVEMEQEHSAENGETETEYVYSVYAGGELVEQTAVEFETEKNGTREEVEYELEFRKGGAKGRYVVERETENGKAQITVKYDIGGTQGEFFVTIGQTYSYAFSDGTVLSF